MQQDAKSRAATWHRAQWVFGGQLCGSGRTFGARNRAGGALNDDLCRDTALNDDYIKKGYVCEAGWYKSTFTSLDATADATLVADLFDGQRIPAPYQEPWNKTAFLAQGCSHFAQV